MRVRLSAVLGGALIALLTIVSAGTSAPSQADPEIEQSKGFRKAVTLAGVRAHQQALQTIANDNGGTRASGTPGYAASANYVVSTLQSAGYATTTQQFSFTYTEENSELVRISPNARTFVNETDFLRNRFDSGTPEGTWTGSLVNVDLVLNPSGPANTSTSGCDAVDFAGFPAGAVALVQRGTCGFNVKVLNAQAAGAGAVIVMNEGQPGRTGLVGMIGDATGLTIPAVFATFDAGLNLANTASSVVKVTVDFLAETRTTSNVIAETAAGDPNNVVVVGAHLDSVKAGPGINDNGSGSAAILEIAETYASQERTPRNKVRFIWFGAEESGLLGSDHYVDNLSNAQKDSIALMLNFDMLGSPNFVRFVYDGDGSSGTAGPPGSDAIEEVFETYFASQDLAIAPTAFDGRSDYGPFIGTTSPGHEDGIPAGGLFSGAEGIKTAAQAVTYGGTAGQQYDPCYHQACDTFANNSDTGLDQLTDAAAHAVLTWSKRKDPIAP